MPVDFDPAWRRPRPGPRSGQRLRRLAKRCTDAARDEIPARSGMLVSIAAQGSGAIRLQWWHPVALRCAEIIAAPGGFAPRATAIGALQRAGASLLAQLACRHEAGCAPVELVTDGWNIAVHDLGGPANDLAGHRYAHGASAPAAFEARPSRACGAMPRSPATIH